MTNILVVFTGGTIGSTTNNGTINTDTSQGYKLLELFGQSYSGSKPCCFKTIQPVQILSENLYPIVWETVIKAIEAENTSQFDGIIVTHGTDTLAFSAAAISLYFNAITVPVLLVSSDMPLGHPQANGLNNFHCAVEFIKQRKEGGVFVPYKNKNADTQVHLGARIASCLQVSSDFVSVQSKPYLIFTENIFYQENEIVPSERTPIKLKANFSTRILLIKPYPGLNYSLYNLDEADVVLHDLYHSGTACSSENWGKNHSLKQFIKRCNQKEINLYMAPAIKNRDSYESTQLLIKQGAKMIWDMSLEVSYTKLILAYGNFKTADAVQHFLEQDIANEHI